jgi:hypothetical protein
MPVKMVQNNQPGPTVLSIDPKGTESVEWQGKGDLNGEDVQPVSEAMQECVAYRKAVRRGVLLELDDDALDFVNDAEERQQRAWEARQNISQTVADQAIEQTTKNDYVAFDCLGSPSCENKVSVREVEKDNKPPLCKQHEPLASQFVPQQDIVGGRPAVRWTRVTMGARESAN